MILKICSLKIGSESFSYKPKGILSTLFFHLSNKKKGSQKGFETFPFKQKIFFAFFKLLLLLLLLYTIFMISCLKVPCIVALFVWLFKSFLHVTGKSHAHVSPLWILTCFFIRRLLFIYSSIEINSLFYGFIFV